MDRLTLVGATHSLEHMFDTVVEVADWEVCDLVPSDPAVELPTVWDVLAGRVDPGPDAIRALASVDPRGLGAAARAEVVSAWEAQDGWLEAQKLSALDAMSAPEPVVDVADPADRGFVVVPERVRVEEARLALGCSPGWAELEQVEQIAAMAVTLDSAAELPEGSAAANLNPLGWGACQEKCVRGHGGSVGQAPGKVDSEGVEGLFPAVGSGPEIASAFGVDVA